MKRIASKPEQLDIVDVQLGVATVAILAIFAAIAIGMSGCETTEGFGRDMKNLGNNIEDSAEKNDID